MRKLNTNKIQILHRIRLRKYNPEKPPQENHQETQWQVDDNIVAHKMIYIQMHGKRNLLDTYLIFLSYIPTLTQLILMIVMHRDQVLSLSHVPIFMIQTTVKTGKHAPYLTHRYYTIQRLNRMVKVRTLRPLLT